MKAIAFVGDARLRTATPAGARWITHLHLWRPTAEDRLTTGEAETAAVVLSGTFDLIGGATAWPARGARASEFVGRPMAVFLPKQTLFRAERGAGEILLVAARQPAAAPAATGREAFSQKPLLPLAGSGKAFDPNLGEWRPAETFPDAPESLPPRRMERVPVGAVTVERVLGKEYKAATLSIDEIVLCDGQSLRLAQVPGRPDADEVLVFLRAEGSATLAIDGNPSITTTTGDAAFLVPLRTGTAEFSIAATSGRAYVLLAYAGKT